MAHPVGAKPDADLVAKFKDLTKQDIESQSAFFLKSFVFNLPDWKDLIELQKMYVKSLTDAGEGKPDLNVVQAADLLQKKGAARTALERNEELADIDLDTDGRICFLEYALLTYKQMILEAYYDRKGEKCPFDLSRKGVGVTGCGAHILDELMYMPEGLSPELIAALDAFEKSQRERAAHIKKLEDTAAAGGVKGLAAKNELEQLATQDSTEMNKLEITLNAAKRKQSKNTGAAEVERKKKLQADEEAAQKRASKAKLAAMRSAFEGK